MTSSFNTIAVIGAGTMGHGIAQVAASKGSKVKLIDSNLEFAEAGRDKIDSSLARFVAKEKLTEPERDDILARVEATDDLSSAVHAADVVIEAVPEDLGMKRDLFGTLAAEAPAHALLGSNTSSLSIGRIAEDNPANARIIGLHFFNPVPLMALLEIVKGADTSDETVARAQEFGRYLGKDSILVKDMPGFATSRLGVLLGLEAIRMVQDGVASPADIDKAMELGYRHPMGPLKLTDLVGLDVRLAIADHLHTELGAAQFDAPPLLREMVKLGKLGRKSGEGFYKYDS